MAFSERWERIIRGTDSLSRPICSPFVSSLPFRRSFKMALLSLASPSALSMLGDILCALNEVANWMDTQERCYCLRLQLLDSLDSLYINS